jgi:hypothetical protein
MTDPKCAPAPWVRVMILPAGYPRDAVMWTRSVEDGELQMTVTRQPMGFVVQLAHLATTPEQGRWPRLDEISDALTRGCPKGHLYGFVLEAGLPPQPLQQGNAMILTEVPIVGPRPRIPGRPN